MLEYILYGLKKILKSSLGNGLGCDLHIGVSCRTLMDAVFLEIQ